MTWSRWVRAGILLVTAAGLVAATQAPDPVVRGHIEAFFQALASGDPARFEAMAQEHFAPDMLARRTPADRQGLVARIHSDFGTLTLLRVERPDDASAVLTMRGSTGLEGRVELRFDPAPPRRIVQVGIQVGGPPDDEAAGPLPPIDASMAPATMGRALDAYLTPLVASDAFAGVVLVARNGTPVYEQAFGMADRGKKVPATRATRYNVGSIGKIFTKTAIAQLIAQKKLSLSDTIGALLPDYPNAAARKATVEQLVNHQAGIVDFFGPAFDEAPKTQFRSNADYYRFVAPQPLLFEPGSKRQYCNGCYIVLGAIIERVSGVKYEDYVAAHVFGPAGMKGAGFFQADHPPADVAIGYTRRGPGGGDALVDNLRMHGMAGSGAGGAYATAADLLAFDSALREGRLLDPKMTAWVLDGDVTPTGTRSRADFAFAGGAPGVNAALEADGTWTVAVVANLDPPAATRLGAAIKRALSR